MRKHRIGSDGTFTDEVMYLFVFAVSFFDSEKNVGQNKQKSGSDIFSSSTLRKNMTSC
jgi:hypothetical protein